MRSPTRAVALTSCALLLAACQGTRSPAPAAIDARADARWSADVADAAPPTTDAEVDPPDPPDAGLPTCECPVASACQLVRRRPLSDALSRELGLRIVAGQIRCDPEVVGCAGPLPLAGHAELWDVPGCGFWTDRLLVVGRDAYAWSPMSIGERGGPGFGLARTRVADARTLRPLGAHFLADARGVCRDEPIADADPATFRVLDCPVAARRCVACDGAACFHEAGHGWRVTRVPRRAEGVTVARPP